MQPSVATRSKEWVCELSLAGIAGLNPVGSVDVFLFRVLRVGRQRCATGRSFVQRSLASVVGPVCVIAKPREGRP
jgi:hypothetical protein